MTNDLHNLIDALRNELQQYGEMLALLDHQQQDLASPQSGESLSESVAAIRTHSATLQAARERRQALQQKLARALAQSENASLTELTPLLPEAYRPLLGALVQENNELLERVGQRARQNQHHLQDSLEMLRNFIATLSPPHLTCLPAGSLAPVLEAASPPPGCEAAA